MKDYLRDENFSRAYALLCQNGGAKTFENWQIGVITSQKSFENCFGKKASAVKSLKAGNLDTSFYIYR